jgi:hypothetical protein
MLLKLLFSAAFFLPGISGALAEDTSASSTKIEVPPEYKAYEDCVKKLATDVGVTDLLKLKQLSTIRTDLVAEIEKCERLLPTEDKADSDKLKATFLILSDPKERSGVEHGPLSASTGAIVQTRTGASLMLHGDAAINLPRESVFSLTSGYHLSLSGDVLVGSTASGASVVPGAKVSLQAGRVIDGTLEEETRKKLDQQQINTAGLNAARIRELIGATFDRSVSMDRPWDVSAGYGRELSVSGPGRGASVTAMGQVGVGATGKFSVIPYARLMIGGKGYICKSISGDHHLLCANGELAAGLGLIQAKLDLGVGGEYRYVASDDASKWFHSVSAGPTYRQELQADVAGGHAASQGLFMITVR